MKIEIQTMSNGYMITEHWYSENEDTIYHVVEELEDHDEVDSMINLLYKINEILWPWYDKFWEKNIKITTEKWHKI
jgi:transcriptional regulator of NAD metabolism